VPAKAISVPTRLHFPRPEKKRAQVSNKGIAIQDLYSLTVVVLGFVCLTFVGAGRSTAKMAENKKNHKRRDGA